MVLPCFSVMLAPGSIEGFTQLAGPANDIRLMEQVMRERGVMPALISSVEGTAATREGMLAVMAKPLPCLRERDQLVLVYSGWGTVYPYEWFDPAHVLRDMCGAAANDTLAALCSTLNGPSPPLGFRDDLMGEANAAIASWLLSHQPMTNHLPGQRMHVLIGAGSRASDGALDRLDGVTAAEVSNYVTRVRNAGADIFLIIDTRLAANGDLLALQQQAAAPAIGPSMARPCCSMAAFHRTGLLQSTGTCAAVRERRICGALCLDPARRGL